MTIDNSFKIQLLFFILKISGSSCDNTVLAENDTIHLLNVQFSFGHSKGEGDSSHFLPLDKYIFLYLYLPLLEDFVPLIFQLISWFLEHFGTGKVEFYMIIFMPTKSQIQSDCTLVELTTFDRKRLKPNLFNFEMLLILFSFIKIGLHIWKLSKIRLTIIDKRY